MIVKAVEIVVLGFVIIVVVVKVVVVVVVFLIGVAESEATVVNIWLGFEQTREKVRERVEIPGKDSQLLGSQLGQLLYGGSYTISSLFPGDLFVVFCCIS